MIEKKISNPYDTYRVVFGYVDPINVWAPQYQDEGWGENTIPEGIFRKDIDEPKWVNHINEDYKRLDSSAKSDMIAGGYNRFYSKENKRTIKEFYDDTLRSIKKNGIIVPLCLSTTNTEEIEKVEHHQWKRFGSKHIKYKQIKFKLDIPEPIDNAGEGGTRLWAARKLGIKIPAIISDFHNHLPFKSEIEYVSDYVKIDHHNHEGSITHIFQENGFVFTFDDRGYTRHFIESTL